MIDPDIFSAEDLVSNPEKFSSIEPAIRLGVIGDPVAHSRSPVFQNAALAACGIPARYTRLHVPPERFVDAVRALPRAGFLGANVTIPHKAAALAVVIQPTPVTSAFRAAWPWPRMKVARPSWKLEVPNGRLALSPAWA